MEQLLTTRELASRLRISPATVRHWTHAGLIPAIKIKSNVLRYDYDAVKAALERKRSTNPGGKERHES